MPFIYCEITHDGMLRRLILRTRSQVYEAIKLVDQMGLDYVEVYKSPEVDAYAAEENDWAWSVKCGLRLYSTTRDRPWIKKTTR
jgi:hypothetical protein